MKYIKTSHPAFRRVTEEKWQVLCQLPTPCYVLEEEALRRNGEILRGIQDRTGCKILLAQKAFSNFNLYPMLFEYLAGTEASGLYETRLGKTYMPQGECHVFCGAYKETEFAELLKYADHIVFNSVSQLKKYGGLAKQAGKSIGLRINPECSTQEGHEIYDPCAPGGRLGVTKEIWEEQMTEELVSLLDGLHFHTLCEQNADALEITLRAVEERFGEVLKGMKWLNMGGGHHITREDYDVELLLNCVQRMQEAYNLEIYLEPGEAVALNAGYLVSEVLDVTRNGAVVNAILDMSAACHTPDVIEMPYRPPVMNSGEKDEKKFTYCFGGPTCLSGDVVGDYSFDDELKEGDKILFGDMAIYTTCKNNTFNGMKLPDIYLLKEDGSTECLARFGYDDFEGRLGESESL
ncbi:MAG: carboxynorspermidine decarboxylase [Lachnospiraceae bacterium]|nr:carboxynorspermidine decarboxylase [Lachnospiraceae bacterium]